MNEKVFDILMILWADLGALVFALICLYLNWIIPFQGLFGSQFKLIIDYCNMGAMFCPIR